MGTSLESLCQCMSVILGRMPWSHTFWLSLSAIDHCVFLGFAPQLITEICLLIALQQCPSWMHSILADDKPLPDLSNPAQWTCCKGNKIKQFCCVLKLFGAGANKLQWEFQKSTVNHIFGRQPSDSSIEVKQTTSVSRLDRRDAGIHRLLQIQAGFDLFSLSAFVVANASHIFTQCTKSSGKGNVIFLFGLHITQKKEKASRREAGNGQRWCSSTIRDSSPAHFKGTTGSPWREG